jgi:PhnB protein
MISINPYLSFMGNAEEAMNFYKSVFGGEFASFLRFSDSPDHEKIPKSEHSRIMHASLPLGAGHVLMAADTLESIGQTLTIGNNIRISINPESEEETNRLFNALSEGGGIEMPLTKTFWGSYFGLCVDKFGIQWMFNFDLNLAG